MNHGVLIDLACNLPYRYFNLCSELTVPKNYIAYQFNDIKI